MKLEKIEYRIGCDIAGCDNLSTYRLTFGDFSHMHICSNCALKLKRELRNVT